MKDGIRDATTAANAAAAEAELARKQYVASNRPKLRVRKVSVTEPTVGEPFVVRYEVVNLGGTKATILTNIVTLTIKPVSVYEEEAGAKGISFSKFEMFANEIQQGESVLAQIEIANFDASLYWADCVPGWWADHLFVIGVIKYADENGVARRTAFYRVATENLNRFEVAKLSDGALADHEYED